jgi:hypothetical protein
MKPVYGVSMIAIHLAILAVLVVIIFEIRAAKKVSEGYYLADYYKLKQCRCVPQYDTPTFTAYN